MTNYTLPIIAATVAAGYFLKSNQKRNLKESVQNVARKSEIPNSKNIYDSDRVNEINQELLDMAYANYVKGDNTNDTGMLPSIINDFGSAGNREIISGQAKRDNIKEQRDAFEINKFKNPFERKQKSIDNRPMFSAGSSFEKEDASIEMFSGDTNPLTGKAYDNTHDNMVPFFGSVVKQNTEGFSNESLLDKYTGNTHVFEHKKEQGKMFENFEENIYGSQVFTASVEADRFIPSLYKQSEKPFDEERIRAEKSGSIMDNIRPEFRDINELRVKSNPQISYEARTVVGQMGEVRGVQSDFKKQRPDTFYEQGSDRLLVTTGRDLAHKMDEKFIIKDTSKSDVLFSYYGNAGQKDSLATKQRLSKGECGFESCVQDDRRIQLKADTTRNFSGNKSQNDYGKSGIMVFNTERETTSVEHVKNPHRVSSGVKIGILDDIKTTLKETVLKNDNSGYISSQFNKNRADMAHNGMENFTPKTTHKESTLLSNYVGQAENLIDGYGYLSNEYSAKTTGKETVLFGHIGNADGYKDMKSRVLYENAEINDRNEILNERKYSSGPQKFNISGSSAVVGELDTRDSVLFKEQEDTREKINHDYRKSISSMQHIGVETTPSFNKLSNTENRHLDFNLARTQLKENPYAL